MNYLQHPNLLVQFWAALNTEYDKILDTFVRNDGWLFQDMGMVAKKGKLSDIQQCISTSMNPPTREKGGKLDHFVRVNFVVLDAAKTQWLIPWRTFVVDPSSGVIPPFLKRQIGGFFLLYMLFTSQPVSHRMHKKQKILMDQRDLIAMHCFTTTIQRLPKTNEQFKELAKQIVILYNDLIANEAFEFCSVSDVMDTTKTGVRKLLAAKFCTFTNIIYKLKDVRDQLYYITRKESVPVFQSLVSYGKLISKSSTSSKSEVTAGESEESKEKNIETEFHPIDKPWSLDEIKALENVNDIGVIAHSLPTILKSLDMGPILTRHRLTGITDGLLDMEMQKCVKVHRAKESVIGCYMEKKRNNPQTAEKEKNKAITLRAWRCYMRRDYSWIDEMLNRKNLMECETSIKNETSTSNGGTEFRNDENAQGNDANVYMGEDEDNEWDTEEEIDENDEMDNVRVLNNRRQESMLSMPTLI